MQIFHYSPATKEYLGSALADESPLEPGCYLLPANSTSVAPPEFNAETHTCKFENNKWIVELKPEVENTDDPPIDYTEQNSFALWQAATKYEQQYISGSALSLLTIGVLQGLPISLEVKFWINTLWMSHYYPRKAQITGDEPIPKEMLDFSLIGPMPYSVPELAAEVEGIQQTN